MMPTTAERADSPTATSLRTAPGEPGIWVFVLGDLSVFALFFATYMYSRIQNPNIFNQDQAHLSLFLGSVNTIILLTSSLCLAIAVAAHRRQQPAARWARWALASGIGFIVLKSAEWFLLLTDGHSVGTGEFFMYYFTFTGIHLAHVVIGCGVLGFVAALTSKRNDPRAVRTVETAAIYWHMVDAIWLLMFAVLYLVS